MKDFISLFPKTACHLNCFEAANKTSLKIHDFILEFHNTKSYFISLVVYVIK
jgi:hypothetical protein